MKTWLPPLVAILLCTGLTTWCCHLSGFPRHDLWIAAAVTFGISASAAVTAVTVASLRPPDRSRQP